MWGKELRLWRFEGDFGNVSDLCEILCKVCHKLLKVHYNEDTPEIFINSTAWILSSNWYLQNALLALGDSPVRCV